MIFDLKVKYHFKVTYPKNAVAIDKNKIITPINHTYVNLNE